MGGVGRNRNDYFVEFSYASVILSAYSILALSEQKKIDRQHMKAFNSHPHLTVTEICELGRF